MKTHHSIIIGLLFACLTGSVQAVVISEWNEQYDRGDGAGAGWNYTGHVNSASGIFLGQYGGDYWVMTNTHVGAGDFHLDGETYEYEQGSAVQVGQADMILYKIKVQDGDSKLSQLPNLKLSGSNSSIENDSQVVMIGYGGLACDPSRINWKVNTEVSPDEWSTNMDDPGTLVSGYQFTGGTSGDSKRWGTNTALITHGQDTIRLLFDDAPGEGQAVVGDSGGGIFYYDTATETWELAGLMSYVATRDGQPGDAIVFGNSTIALSMQAYLDDIYAILYSSIPEPGTAGLLVISLAIAGLGRRKGGFHALPE